MKIKNLFLRRVTSLLLVFLLVFSILSTGSLAVEITEEPHIHTENCTHEDASASLIEEKPLDEETGTGITTSIDNTDILSFSGVVGESTVYWNFDPSTGHLIISGSGNCEVFQSPDDQPWACFRTEITEVWFDSMDALAIPDLAYWFTGCTALTTAEIPYTTPIIGTAAFADCPMLTNIQFYYYDTDEFEIVPGAFSADSTVATTIWVVAEQQRAVLMAYLYDWEGDNRVVQAKDIYGLVPLAGCAIGSCSCSSCSSTYTYRQLNDTHHEKYVSCTNCSASFWLADNKHSFSGNTCTICGYTKSSGGDSGGGGTTVCTHPSTTTSWSGCTWTDYCRSCGAYVRSGTSHSYSYGSWSYYSSTQHKRTATCTSCHTTTTSYGNHSTSTKYIQYSDTQHKTGKYCSACSSYVGSTSYANHSLTYGSWSVSSDTAHVRTKTCSSCGYSGTETAAHTDGNDDGNCDGCAYLMTRFSVTVPANMSLAVANDGYVYSATNAAVVNNSSHTVKITSVTVTAGDGWTIVPYNYNMADEKVDSKLIGFYLNDAITKQIGTSEKLSLPTNWTIDSGDYFMLEYDAVVSATSDILTNEQVLTLVFVINWAPR